MVGNLWEKHCLSLAWDSQGEDFATAAALQGGELGRVVILSCKGIRVVGPAVMP